MIMLSAFHHHYKRNLLAFCLCAAMLMAVLAGCSSNKDLVDGTYKVDVSMEGGTGKATIESPAELTVADGKMQVTLIWSSKNYDYMLVADEKYLNQAEEGENSKFTIPVEDIDEPLTVIGDTTAMSVPHEIEYTLTLQLKE